MFNYSKSTYNFKFLCLYGVPTKTPYCGSWNRFYISAGFLWTRSIRTVFAAWTNYVTPFFAELYMNQTELVWLWQWNQNYLIQFYFFQRTVGIWSQVSEDVFCSTMAANITRWTQNFLKHTWTCIASTISSCTAFLTLQTSYSRWKLNIVNEGKHHRKNKTLVKYFCTFSKCSTVILR